MLIYLPKTISQWSINHKILLLFITGASLASLAGMMIYGILPVILSLKHGEWYAGMIIGGFSLFDAFLIGPIAGNLADKIGGKRTVMLGLIFGIAAGTIWLTLPIENTLILLLSLVFLFASFSLRGVSETYILRMAKKNEGGIAFGLFGNINSLAIFLATATLPFFVLTEHRNLAAWALILVYFTSFMILFFLPNDVPDRKTKSGGLLRTINPFPTFKNGWHFIKKNNLYPILTMGANLFEGIFFGAIWFIFPLHLAKIGIAGGENGLHLGIYDLVTAFFAGYAGFLADKYSWRHIHSLGWIFVIFGLLAMPFYDWPIWLIIIGFVIAIGNNLSSYAAAHVLEAKDIDHHEDGSFIALRSIVNSIGYGISPIIAGFLYSRFGFHTSLSANSLLCISIAVAMIWFTWKLEKNEKKSFIKKIFS